MLWMEAPGCGQTMTALSGFERMSHKWILPFWSPMIRSCWFGCNFTELTGDRLLALPDVTVLVGWCCGPVAYALEQLRFLMRRSQILAVPSSPPVYIQRASSWNPTSITFFRIPS